MEFRGYVQIWRSRWFDPCFFIDLCVVYVFLHDYLSHFRLYNSTSTQIVLPTHTHIPGVPLLNETARNGFFIFLPFRPDINQLHHVLHPPVYSSFHPFCCRKCEDCLPTFLARRLSIRSVSRVLISSSFFMPGLRTEALHERGFTLFPQR